VAGFATGFPYFNAMTPNEDLEQIKRELKRVIEIKFDHITGRTGGFDDEIVDDEDGKQALFEDRHIRELLDALLCEQEEKLLKIKQTKHKEYDDFLKEELESVLREMALESEGIAV